MGKLPKISFVYSHVYYAEIRNATKEPKYLRNVQNSCISTFIFLHYDTYSSKKMRKTQNEHLNMICQNLNCLYVVVNSKLISYFFGVAFLSRNYWGQLNHHLIANI